MNVEQGKRRDNFMHLARMANVVPVDHFYVTDVFLETFAEMVAAEEREACAKVCEEIPLPEEATSLTHLPTIERCAAAIRARGEQDQPR